MHSDELKKLFLEPLLGLKKNLHVRCCCCCMVEKTHGTMDLAPVVQTMDSAIRR